MIPEDRLSTTYVKSIIAGAKKLTVNDLIDYEDGGIGLNDPSAGLLYQIWTCRTDGTHITVEAPNTAATTIYTGTDISLVSLTFDQNMNPAIAFIEEDVAKFRWYDSSIEGYVVSAVGGGFPRIFLDDKRPIFISDSDIILAYTKNANLYFRMQRDRYLIEYLLLTGIGCDSRLVNLGMGKNLRLLFIFNLGDDLATCATFDQSDPYEVSGLN